MNKKHAETIKKYNSLAMLIEVGAINVLINSDSVWTESIALLVVMLSIYMMTASEYYLRGLNDK